MYTGADVPLQVFRQPFSGTPVVILNFTVSFDALLPLVHLRNEMTCSLFCILVMK